MAIAFWAGTVRSLFLRVFAKRHGIVMRGPTRTTTIPWDEVEEITLDSLAGSPAGAAGAVAPIVMQRLPDGGVKRVELNVIGGYGVSPQRPTPAEQAMVGLRECWDDWRRRQLATDQNKNAAG